jgi:dienelactone hydrolase
MTTSDNNNKAAALWDGASIGVAAATVLICAVTGYLILSGLPRGVGAVAFAVAGALVLAGLFTASRFVARRLERVPPQFRYVAVAALGTLYVLRSNRFRFRWDPSLFYPASIAVLFAIAVFFGAYWARHSEGSRKLRRGLVVASVVFLVAGFVWIRDDGRDPYPVVVTHSAPLTRVEVQNPAARGPFELETLTYGSGGDERRPEFGAEVDLVTKTVDASKIVPEWKGFKARARRWYWGFSIEHAPLNARVWLPVGDGPFPLVVVVHGNHAMEDDSDAGYAYLGELLASRGFITASIDENYVNGTWSGDFGGKEMPVRAWLVLEHLRLWHEWNATAGHRFHGKVDIDRIGLIGHSRGGEAVSVAYAFNDLDRFPDDATVEFDYGFSIRALVAIAQTDRHYPRRVELENVNFLTLQGSYDSDEASSFGMRQFRRIRLDRDVYRFKAGVYVHGANHGQFNTAWGMDSGPPASWLLNRAPLLSAADQQEVAKVYIAAFLEATLHGDTSYAPLFRDPRVGADWLPHGVTYLAQFEDSTFTAVADFEEDLDVATASLDGAVIESAGMAVWREEQLRFRDDLTQGTHGVVLGSDGESPASYAIRFGGRRPRLDPAGELCFFLSSSTEKPGKGEAAMLELTVELEDDEGAARSIAIAEIAPVTPPLKIQYLKLAWLNRERFPKNWEPTFQSYGIPLRRFAGVDVERLSAIRFRTEGSGVVILDDIGFRN